jgi:uncharacterized membrane protein
MERHPDLRCYRIDSGKTNLGGILIMLGLAYIGMAYLSWTLARLMLGVVGIPLSGLRLLTLPLVAACTMVAWDVCQDPVWSTVLHAWVWLGGGPYFGVPLINFFGLTVYLIFQLFALHTWRWPISSVTLFTMAALTITAALRLREHAATGRLDA